jgi:hypothetical protein
MSFISQLFSGSAADIVGKVGDALDNLTTSKEEKLQAEVELKKVELQHEVQMRASDVEEQKNRMDDTKSARQMQVAALAQDDKFTKRFTAYLTIGSIILSFGYIFCITFIAIPEQSLRFADTILGVVIGLVIGTIYTFWFGSSSGSSQKTDAIINSMKK